MLRITALRVEDRVGHVITDRPRPSFGVALDSDRTGVTVAGHRIVVAAAGRTVWDSGRVESEATQGLRYEGDPLAPFTRHEVTITVWDDAGEQAQAAGSFETGRMGATWDARWIADPGSRQWLRHLTDPRPLVFGHRLALRGPVRSARLYGTALGVYTVTVNDRPVGEDWFAPGYTSYDRRLEYQVHDVTELVTADTAIEATVTGGWAVGAFTPMVRNRVYAPRPALLLELRVEYLDGETEVFGTGPSWQVTGDGPVRAAGFYRGEAFDARPRRRRWRAASVTAPPGTPEIVAASGEPVRVRGELAPLSRTPSHRGTIYDFGQNFAGVVRLRIRDAKAGQRIVVRHAEAVQHGELYTRALRLARARLDYTCVDGPQEYTPTHTYMGFRYAEVRGIAPEDVEVTGLVLSSVGEPDGSFECSNPALNRLQQNILWSAKSNFVGIPTDCPQRDERQGWTGDIAVFASTAAFDFDVSRFLGRWLEDLRTEQHADGGIPHVVPAHRSFTEPGFAVGWSDACITVPWDLYLAYGDVRLLEDSFETMRRYMDGIAAHAVDPQRPFVRTGNDTYGDWLAPGGGKKQWRARTPWIGTAFYGYLASIMANVCAALDRTEQQRRYEQLARDVAEAFRQEFIRDGDLHDPFQTGYVLPLYAGLFDDHPELTASLGRHLAEQVRAAGTHLGTGFLGTPYLLFALSDTGQLDTAYDLLLQTGNPSWLYQVERGATTIWERWDSIPEDGRIRNTGNMLSFNHYANGAVGDWLYRRVAGIEAVEPGYRRFRVRPLPGGGLTHASATTRSPYGRIRSAWTLTDTGIDLEVEVPVGTRCEIVLPDGTRHDVGSGTHRIPAREALR